MVNSLLKSMSVLCIRVHLCVCTYVWVCMCMCVCVYGMGMGVNRGMRLSEKTLDITNLEGKLKIVRYIESSLYRKIQPIVFQPNIKFQTRSLLKTQSVRKNNYCFMINKAHWPPISINIYQSYKTQYKAINNTTNKIYSINTTSPFTKRQKRVKKNYVLSTSTDNIVYEAKEKQLT